MNRDRFAEITSRYNGLRVAVIGDFCLDRYLEIDPSRAEVSIETGLPVHNVIRVRAQPGGAGTILCNLAALGIGELWPVGFCGDDGEGYELRRALAALPGVRLDHFLTTGERRTFTYCKPLVLDAGKPPRELNRLDSKNWTPTPVAVADKLAAAVRTCGDGMDAILVLDQVDLANTGVITPPVLAEISALAGRNNDLQILADSRRGLRDFPRIGYKMNRDELAAMTGTAARLPLAQVQIAAAQLAKSTGNPVFVTLSEEGIVGADAAGEVAHCPARPVCGAIDIVGAGDAVAANLATALAAGASMSEALELAMSAASVVVHQLGTTGAASVAQLRAKLF
ncbi:MAG: carbohydrate kinase [Pedosphaera sp.]|nr:carbohydrate kinase [Pedosphaera sp.]